jgi:hypothetical protein
MRMIQWKSGEGKGKFKMTREILPSTVRGALSCMDQPFEVFDYVAYLVRQITIPAILAICADIQAVRGRHYERKYSQTCGLPRSLQLKLHDGKTIYMAAFES